MSNKTINLSSSLYAYLKNNSLREHEVLKRLRQETELVCKDPMQISSEQGQFMQLLMELLGAQKTLDIGTFTGYSALAVALALPDTGTVIACDTSREWTDIAKQYWAQAGVAHKIDLKLAPALETLDDLLAQGEANTFDFAFIDADKEHYNDYYERCLALVRAGGLIAVDNVLWGGRVADPAITDPDTVAIRTLNTRILADERVSISMLPIGDGLTLARKRVF